LIFSLADLEAVADGLNPLMINHTANAISCKPTGRLKISPIVEKGFAIIPNIINKVPNKHNTLPKKPQTDNHLGISFD
jgi:hypothetical protein